MGNRISFWEKVKARHLQSDAYALLTFITIFVIATVFYVQFPEGLFGEFQVQISTSLLATIFITAFDFYTKYQNFENEEFIENLYEFGIHNLHFDKQSVLERLVSRANSEIWVSGYRLILTKRLSRCLHEARKRNVSVRLLLCPPWSGAHGMVYDDLDATLERYISILRSLVEPNQEGLGKVSIRFVEKPLFNDTYLVDNTIVSSPYMHNRDLTYGVMAADNFFTYEVEDRYRLHQLLKNEYEVLYNDAPYELTLDQASLVLSEVDAGGGDISYNDKVKIIKDHLTNLREAQGELHA